MLPVSDWGAIQGPPETAAKMLQRQRHAKPVLCPCLSPSHEINRLSGSGSWLVICNDMHACMTDRSLFF